jgi:hypothetical protein
VCKLQTRRGEFVALGQATNKSFTEKAIAYITKYLHINEVLQHLLNDKKLEINNSNKKL